jgi:hypothetical protein
MTLYKCPCNSSALSDLIPQSWLSDSVPGSFPTAKVSPTHLWVDIPSQREHIAILDICPSSFGQVSNFVILAKNGYQVARSFSSPHLTQRDFLKSENMDPFPQRRIRNMQGMKPIGLLPIDLYQKISGSTHQFLAKVSKFSKLPNQLLWQTRVYSYHQRPPKALLQVSLLTVLDASENFTGVQNKAF